MKKSMIITAALLAGVSSAALAQSNSHSTTGASNGSSNLRQEVTANLQQSGFSNVKVVPDSFLVQANDKSGNAVTMFITPNSMTEVTTTGATNHADSGNQSAGTFTSIPAKDDLSSKVVGLDVYNNSNQNIGAIKDIAYNGKQVSGYILAVGGFLGLGDHYVAVRPAALDLSYNSNDNKWHAKMNANADQLKAAPEYKYPSKS